ncbi:transposable element tcb2 transposase [Trichonephila clavipes]|nr:transposable element tcb2 transposase [Trichonephila clavipes]
MDPTCRQRTVHSGRGSLMESSAELRHFHWPPKSSDMSIIEHISDAWQRSIQKRSPPPLTPTDLCKALEDSWCQLPPALLQTIIKSIPCSVTSACR